MDARVDPAWVTVCSLQSLCPASVWLALQTVVPTFCSEGFSAAPMGLVHCCLHLGIILLYAETRFSGVSELQDWKSYEFREKILGNNHNVRCHSEPFNSWFLSNRDYEIIEFLKIGFIFLEWFWFTAKLFSFFWMENTASSPYTLRLHTCTASPTNNIIHQRRKFVRLNNEPTFIFHDHSKSIVSIGKYSWCCTFNRFEHIDVYPPL